MNIVGEEDEPPLTDAQAEELDRRLKAYQENPTDIIDWETIKAELDSRFAKRKREVPDN